MVRYVATVGTTSDAMTIKALHIVTARLAITIWDIHRSCADGADIGVKRKDERMSEMIKCDKCKKLMYTDSRSDKDAYCKINITYVDGYSTYHLCKACHRQLLTEFLRTYTPEEYDETFGEVEKDG